MMSMVHIVEFSKTNGAIRRRRPQREGNGWERHCCSVGWWQEKSRWCYWGQQRRQNPRVSRRSHDVQKSHRSIRGEVWQSSGKHSCLRRVREGVARFKGHTRRGLFQAHWENHSARSKDPHQRPFCHQKQQVGVEGFSIGKCFFKNIFDEIRKSFRAKKQWSTWAPLAISLWFVAEMIVEMWLGVQQIAVRPPQISAPHTTTGSFTHLMMGMCPWRRTWWRWRWRTKGKRGRPKKSDCQPDSKISGEKISADFSKKGVVNMIYGKIYL